MQSFEAREENLSRMKGELDSCCALEREIDDKAASLENSKKGYLMKLHPAAADWNSSGGSSGAGASGGGKNGSAPSC
jgi:hypothetical protein